MFMRKNRNNSAIKKTMICTDEIMDDFQDGARGQNRTGTEV